MESEPNQFGRLRLSYIRVLPASARSTRNDSGAIIHTPQHRKSPLSVRLRHTDPIGSRQPRRAHDVAVGIKVGGLCGREVEQSCSTVRPSTWRTIANTVSLKTTS